MAFGEKNMHGTNDRHSRWQLKVLTPEKGFFPFITKVIAYSSILKVLALQNKNQAKYSRFKAV